MSNDFVHVSHEQRDSQIFSAHPPGCRNPDLKRLSSPETSDKKSQIVVSHVVSHGRRVIAGRRPQRSFAPFSCRPA